MKAATSLLLGFLVAVPFWYNVRILPRVLCHEMPAIPRTQEFFQVGAHDWLAFPIYQNLKKGIGVVNWYSSIRLPTRVRPRFYKLENGTIQETPPFLYKGEVYLLTGNGDVQLTEIGFNHVKLRANLTAPDTIIVNQNYAPGWRSNRGKVVSADDLLAVEMDRAETLDIELTYRPPGIHWILFFNVFFVVLLAAFFFTPLGDRIVRALRRDTLSTPAVSA